MNQPDRPQIARWSELKPLSKAFLDSHIPAYEKENFRVIGPGVNEDPDSRPVIEGPPWLLGRLRTSSARQGRGPALPPHA
jgi:hypothetical protein